MNFLIRLNSAGVAEILKSQRVHDDLQRRAAAIAKAANGDAGITDGFLSAADIGQNRARAAVFTATAEAMVAEATKRSLTRALDAGRG